MKPVEKRIGWIDLLKVYAIFLVVIGHTIQYVCYPDSFDDVFLFRLIYSFHMPLFLFISGYLSYKKKINIEWLERHFISYMIPFISWTVFMYFVTDRHSMYKPLPYILLILEYPENAYWFLQILFMCNLVLFLDESILKCMRKERPIFFRAFICVFSLFVVHAINKYFSGRFGLGLLSKHLFFFFLGYFHRHVYTEVLSYRKVFANNLVNAVVFLLFWFLVVYYRRVEKPLFYDDLRIFLNSYRLADMICFLYSDLLASLGIWISAILIKHADHLMKKERYLIASYTLPIYVMHFELLRNYTSNTILNAMLSFVLAIMIPISVQNLLSKFDFLNLLLFGKITKKEEA